MHFKKLLKILLSATCILTLCACLGLTNVYAQPSDELYLGGFPAGFVLNTQNVEVIGTCDVFCDDGAHCPAREAGIKSGDIIKSVNNIAIKSANQLTGVLAEDFAVYNMEVVRGGESIKFSLTPVADKSSGKKRLGLLVKDSINGIGTITYIDKANNKFGSLGHPVNDESGNLIEINGGSLYGCTIYDVKKGLRGNPGELKGIFDNSCMIGSVTTNCKCGIFGNISSEFDVSNLKKVKKGNVNDVTIGSAAIYSTLYGDTCEKYEISIVKVDAKNKENRNFVIKINDKRILDKSGGIVQGMSGSPIVQNGKIIGAVTHVFVNDPTRGYGIAIENMTGSY